MQYLKWRGRGEDGSGGGRLGGREIAWGVRDDVGRGGREGGREVEGVG